MHSKDQLFLSKTLDLFDSKITYKTSETSHRIKCVITEPPKIALDQLKQIQLMRKCKMTIDVRDREFTFDFYKEGSVVSKKRRREPEQVKHPFDISVHPDDQKVIDTALNIVCSHPNLCMFKPSIKKDDEYVLELHNLEAIPFSIVETMTSSLSTFITDIVFDFPNQRINVHIKRNDNL